MNFTCPHSARLGPRRIPAIGGLIVLLVVLSTASATGVSGTIVRDSPTDLATMIHPSSAIGIGELAAARASLSAHHSALAEATPAGSPTPSLRASANMVWDAKDGYVLLFGGCNLYDGYVCDGQYLNDTWEFSSGTWTNLTPAISPPVLDGGSSMACD